jgi:hypothetical protein
MQGQPSTSVAPRPPASVEMTTEFRAREDDQNFTRGPLKAGDTLRITSFVQYDIGPDGRFTNIRVGRYGD